MSRRDSSSELTPNDITLGVVFLGICIVAVFNELAPDDLRCGGLVAGALIMFVGLVMWIREDWIMASTPKERAGEIAERVTSFVSYLSLEAEDDADARQLGQQYIDAIVKVFNETDWGAAIEDEKVNQVRLGADFRALMEIATPRLPLEDEFP